MLYCMSGTVKWDVFVRTDLILKSDVYVTLTPVRSRGRSVTDGAAAQLHDGTEMFHF